MEDLSSIIQSIGIISALAFGIYALFKEHRFAKERIKLERILERKISSYTELYGIIMELTQILLQERMLSASRDKRVVEALTDFDRRLYVTLIKRLYLFTLEGKHVFLSDEIGNQVLELVTPAYYRAGVLGFDLMEDLKDENQLRRIVEEFKEKIEPEVVSQKVENITKMIHDDLELERITREFSPTRKYPEKSTEKGSDRFIEEVTVSVIGASIFSYAMVQTLTLFSQAHIGASPYNLPAEAPLIEHAWHQLNLYAPVATIVSLDAFLFLTLMQKFFWSIVRDRNQPIGFKDIITYLLVIIPASAIPWPIQRFFTALLIEKQNWNMHLTPLLMWFLAAIICTYVARHLQKGKVVTLT